jgi:hypothetical protein
MKIEIVHAQEGSFGEDSPNFKTQGLSKFAKKSIDEREEIRRKSIFRNKESIECALKVGN